MEYSVVDIAAMIDEEAARQGVPADFARKIVLQGENAGRKTIPDDAYSPKLAHGVAQVMPTTWASLVKQGKISPEARSDNAKDNIAAGIAVMKERLDARKGNRAAAAADYNGGIAAGDAVMAGKAPPALETQKYLGRMGFAEDTPTTQGTQVTTSKTVRGTPQQQATLLEQLHAYNASRGALSEELSGKLTDAAGNAANASKAIQSYGNVAGEAVEAAGAIEVAKVLTRAAVLDTMSGSVLKPDTEMVRMRNEQLGAQLKKDELRKVIDAEDSVQIWDNPLRWLANQFTQPGLKAEFNAANAQDADLERRQQNLQQRIQNQTLLDMGPLAGKMERHAALQASAVKFKATADAEDAMFKANSTLAQAVQHKAVFEEQSFDNQVKVARIAMDTMHMNRNVSEDKEAQGMLDVINVKRQGVGLEVIPSLTAFKALGPQKASAMIEWALTKGYGAGPGDSMATLTAVNADVTIGNSDPLAAKAINQQIGTPTYNAEFKALKDDPGFKKLSNRNQQIEVLNRVFEKQKQELVNEKLGNNKFSAGSPYILKLGTAATAPELQTNMFAKHVANLVSKQTPAAAINDDAILQEYMARVKLDPQRQAEYAQQLSDFYLKGLQFQWSESKNGAIGYPKPKTYRLDTDMTHYTSDKPVDMASLAAIQHWTTKWLLAEQRAYPGMDPFGFDTK